MIKTPDLDLMKFFPATIPAKLCELGQSKAAIALILGHEGQLRVQCADGTYNTLDPEETSRAIRLLLVIDGLTGQPKPGIRYSLAFMDKARQFVFQEQVNDDASVQ